MSDTARPMTVVWPLLVLALLLFGCLSEDAADRPDPGVDAGLDTKAENTPAEDTGAADNAEYGLCLEFCEGRRPCGEDQFKLNCREFCDSQEEISTESGCSNEYAEVLTCSLAFDDLCDEAKDACRTEGMAFGDCSDTYCESHATRCGACPTPEDC